MRIRHPSSLGNCRNFGTTDTPLKTSFCAFYLITALVVRAPRAKSPQDHILIPSSGATSGGMPVRSKRAAYFAIGSIGKSHQNFFYAG